MPTQAYRAAHREELAAYKRAYDAAHREERRAYNRAYYPGHKEEQRARDAAYRAAHREEQRAYKRAYDTAHPEQVAAHNAARRARKRNQFVSHVSFDDIWLRDKGICQVCRRRMARTKASLDHILPLSKGGTHEPTNVRLAHLTCNLSRGNRGAAQLRMMA